MFQRKTLISVMVAALISSALVFAADKDKRVAQTKAQDQEKSQEQEQVYGSQLMTPEERAEHRAKLRAAKTQAERDQIRKEHHEKMKARAKEQGVTLPDEPPARGMGGGMGPAGMGPGAGRGKGMGPGGQGQGNKPCCPGQGRQ